MASRRQLLAIIYPCAGALALVLRWLRPMEAAGLALALGVLAAILSGTALGRGVRSPRTPRRMSTFLYSLAAPALIVLFRSRLEMAAAVLGLLAVGGGAAEVADVAFGRRHLPWSRARSWSWLVAFVLYGTASSAFLLRWTQGAVLRGRWAGDEIDWIGRTFLATSVLESNDAAVVLVGCLAASLAAAVAASMHTSLDDRVLVPAVSAAVLLAAAEVRPHLLASSSEILVRQFSWGAGVTLVLATIVVGARGVRLSGAVSGWVVGTLLFGLASWRGFVPLAAFVALGTAATRVRFASKLAMGVAQSGGGRRGAANALANSTAGVIFAFLALATPHSVPFTAALVAAFGTAAADTVATEIGQAFGRGHYLITTFAPVRAGTDGAVSWIGTLAGLVAATVVALAAWASGLVPAGAAAVTVPAALVGVTLDSYLGALFERADRIDNETVNLTSTLAGGITAMGLVALTGLPS